jgi:hypothetical protein
VSLSEEELDKISLIKWPGCDVDGDPVTPEQADEILVRTCDADLSTNDRNFEKAVMAIFYRVIPKPDWGEYWWVDPGYGSHEDIHARRTRWDRMHAYQEEMGILDLAYLDNARVCSAYIGGPNGWCDWDGQIGQRVKNIGKWPSAVEVFKDWQRIAEAFPFLRLTCRLLDHEAGHSDGTGQVAVVYDVADGKAVARMPTDKDHSLILKMTSEEDFASAMIANLQMPNREQGVSLDRFRAACQSVAKKMTATKDV